MGSEMCIRDSRGAFWHISEENRKWYGIKEDLRCSNSKRAGGIPCIGPVCCGGGGCLRRKCQCRGLPASTESVPAAEPQAASVQEESAPAPVVQTLFEVSSKGELSAAVKQINEAEGGAYIISLTADITLPQTEDPSDFTAYTIDLLKNKIQLLGNGHTIYNAELEVRDGAQLTLGREDGSDSLTLKGYTAGVSGILVIDSGTLNMYSDVKLTGHMASSNRFGGAVRIQRGAVFNMYGDEIVNNGGETAYSYGGGVAVESADTTFNMYGGTISGNKADLGGICVLEGGVLNLGGGVYANKNALTVQETEISGNSVSGNAGGNLANITGGGIRVMKSSLNMKNSSVSQNTSGGMAAGIYVSGGTDAVASFHGVSFSENKAGYLGGGLFLSGIKSELEN